MEICQKCKLIGQDRRTLTMSCGYDMMELDIPFESDCLKQMDERDPILDVHILRVCKDCRADWLHAIKQWFITRPTETEGCGSGIYIRDFGRNLEVTEEEFKTGIINR